MIPLNDKVILKFCAGKDGRFGSIKSKNKSLVVDDVVVAKIVEGNHLVINGKNVLKNAKLQNVLNKLPGVTLVEHNNTLFLNGSEWDGKSVKIAKMSKSAIIESVLKIHVKNTITKLLAG